jgi:phosphinothricin acetyltransferase
MQESDWPAVARIYKEGLDTGIATFETTVPNYSDWDQAHLAYGRLIATSNTTELGWAALSPVSNRCVYGGVAEISVYVSEQARGRGIGLLLLKRLIPLSEQHGIWTLQSGIFPENTASIRVHEKAGFRLIGRRERVGKRDGVWKDNLLFERRSTTVGID